MSLTDEQLLARARVGDDRDAFGELVRRHQSSVRLFLRHLTRGNAELADDLAQDTFLAAYRGLARFRGEGSLNTWLLGIAHNLWRNERRRQRTVQLEPAHLGELEPVRPSTAASDLHADLAAALGRLEPEERTALHLSYQQGLSHSQIAGVLGWPLGTVKTHLTRSKEKLRTHLASWNPQT